MTLLLLAGTGEARRIARALAGTTDVIASLAGVTRAPAGLAVPTRVGGFGGDAGFQAYLDRQGITAVLDATHPFAARISRRTARVCRDGGVPYCQVLRPEWHPGKGDDWVDLADERAAVDIVPQEAVVFLATGRQSVERYAGMAAKQVICRVVDPPDAPFPFAGGTYLVGRPSSDPAQEAALFQGLGVTWLIARNAGGEAARAKLDAARQLGIRVGMIARPEQPEGDKVASVAAALNWVRGVS